MQHKHESFIRAIREIYRVDPKKEAGTSCLHWNFVLLPGA